MPPWDIRRKSRVAGFLVTCGVTPGVGRRTGA
jgi:hypothetical protein